MKSCRRVNENYQRHSMLLCVTCLTFGAAIRCIPLQFDSSNKINHGDVFITISAHICGVLNGIAGVALISAPPAISAIWFPVHVSATWQVNLKINLGFTGFWGFLILFH